MQHVDWIIALINPPRDQPIYILPPESPRLAQHLTIDGTMSICQRYTRETDAEAQDGSETDDLRRFDDIPDERFCEICTRGWWLIRRGGRPELPEWRQRELDHERED